MDFDDDDFLDFDDFDPEPEPDDPPGDPDYRATVVGDRVTVINWMHTLAVGPLHRSLLRERAAAGVTMADLMVVGKPRDVLVRWLARGDLPRATRALARWAAATGHRRLWLPDRVIPLAPPKRFGSATTTCSNCQTVWSESDPEFWAGVQASGCFPSFCLLCGGDLPQWSLAAKRGTSPYALRR